MQNRSELIKQFTLSFIYLQNQSLDAALKRRKTYIEQAYTSGLDKQHLDMIEAIYFKGKRVQIKGSAISDLE